MKASELETPEQIRPGGLKLKDASRYLGLSQITLRRLIERGELRPNRVTRHLIFSLKELDSFLAK